MIHIKESLNNHSLSAPNINQIHESSVWNDVYNNIKYFVRVGVLYNIEKKVEKNTLSIIWPVTGYISYHSGYDSIELI
jgi:hypothetical protein